MTAKSRIIPRPRPRRESVRTVSLRGDGLLRSFRDNRMPIYYFNTTPFNLLGADAWINRLTFINSTDSFDGQHRHVLVPSGLFPQGTASFAAINNHLLGQPAVANFLRRQGPHGKALFLMFDRQTERAARALGLEVCFPSASLRHRLDSKITTTRLACRAGVASVPHVLTQVDSYESLRRSARSLGPDLVVQLPHGDSGTTTYFISTAADFQLHVTSITAAAQVKVMRRIRCRQATLEACVTRHGTLVGPLLTELIGFPELTPYHGGWCGNELTSTAFSMDIRGQAQRSAQAIGVQLARVGYRGTFGLDFLLDQDTGELYLGELNPRITGATPLTSQAALDRGAAPLLLHHLAEWLSVEHTVDVAAFNESWLAPAETTWGQLILEHTADTVEVVTTAPSTGLWRLHPDGSVSFLRRECQPQAVADETEALFLRTIDVGRVLTPGACIGRLLTRGRLMTDRWQLTSRARAWARAFRTRFTTHPAITP